MREMFNFCFSLIFCEYWQGGGGGGYGHLTVIPQNFGILLIFSYFLSLQSLAICEATRGLLLLVINALHFTCGERKIWKN